jgi:ribosomal protein L11 methyltransferase
MAAAVNLPKRQVQAIIRGLVAAGELSYTFEHGRTFLEPSFDRPVRVAERIVLTPSGRNFLPRPDDVVIQIAAGASFGAGRHPTTRLALRGIEAALDGSVDVTAYPTTRALDIGTGTGVLVIAAVKLGIEEGLGLDIDPCAVAEARANIRLNGLSGRIAVSDDAVEGIDQQFTLIAANLRPPTLERLSTKISALAGPAAAVVMSGIRNEELDGILRVYRGLGCQCVRTDKEDEWAGVVLRKNG